MSTMHHRERHPEWLFYLGLLLLLLGDCGAQCPSDPFPCLCTLPVTEVDCTPRDGRRYTAIPTDSASGTESL